MCIIYYLYYYLNLLDPRPVLLLVTAGVSARPQEEKEVVPPQFGGDAAHPFHSPLSLTTNLLLLPSPLLTPGAKLQLGTSSWDPLQRHQSGRQSAYRDIAETRRNRQAETKKGERCQSVPRQLNTRRAGQHTNMHLSHRLHGTTIQMGHPATGAKRLVREIPNKADDAT